MPMMASTVAYICAVFSQPKATNRNGAPKLVTAEPTLPAPKIPSAVPCLAGSNQAAV